MKRNHVWTSLPWTRSGLVLAALCCAAAGAFAATPAPGGLARHADWQMRVAPPANQPWAEVRSVETNAPAERAGVRPGDRITQVNGVKASSPSAFLDARRATRGGKPVSLVVQRSNEEQRLTFTPRPMALE